MSEVSEGRRRNMSAVRSKNTAPEIELRRMLHREGYRFRLHPRHLPGRPDLSLPRFKAVVFVNGCFWHAHECEKFRWPKTRVEFWQEKLMTNRARDVANIADLTAAGWRVAVVWECALTPADQMAATSTLLEAWLRSSASRIDLAGAGR
jgi:DNA mismatch endonuclease (patch repair protein)